MHIPFWLLIKTIIGVSAIIASGCVINNYFDQDIDKLMERTKNRPTALGLVSTTKTLALAFILFIVGTITLFFVNTLSLIIAEVGLFFYVVIYTIIFKRNSIYGTILGSISGSTPPVIGYVAVTNKFDLGAILLFLILTSWQMPHSYAIGIFRCNDYKNAKIKLLPVVKGFNLTKWHMLFYIIVFAIMNILLFKYNYVGYFYLVTAVAFSIAWIYLCLQGFKLENDDKTWARKMFFFSIICITALSIMMAINPNLS
jgi:heme o synthase